MPDVWYQLLSYVCAHVYFSRIDVLPRRPRLTGPTLLVALHRNGAVDGWVYKSIFPSATFLIASQLRKNLLARAFFTGISVVRDKDTDGDRSANAESMNRCYDLLASGGTLAIFPEGTSSLGPRHLPFKSGAARIAFEAAQRQLPLTIIPLGITYDAPGTFRSTVQVIAGAPFSPTSLTVPQLRQEISTRLEAVGINVDCDDHYRDIRALASFAAPDIPYHLALKTLERSSNAMNQDDCHPERSEGSAFAFSFGASFSCWPALRDSLTAHQLLHPEKSPFSPQSPLLTSVAAILLSPLVLTATLLNAPPLLAAYFAGCKFPDGPNVITLWRILAGAPFFSLWLLAFLLLTIFLSIPILFLAYLVLSLGGLLAYAPWKSHLRHSVNALRFALLRSDYLTFRSTLLQELRSHAS